MSVIDSLRTDAAALLSEGRARLVLGFRRRGGEVVPAFFSRADQLDAMDYDADDKRNPAAYLRKPEVREQMPVAVVARPAVMRSLVQLAAESQIADGEVIVLGVDGETYHGVLDIPAAAKLLSEKYAEMPHDEPTRALLAELEAMSGEQRADFWRQELAKCTRCYACRAACPACYCQQCIVERNTPQWVSTAARQHGNYAWNVIRAFHLTGRCTVCGACEAACPQGIRLMALNAKLADLVEAEFDAKAGYDPEAEPVLGSWREDDNEDYIL